MSMNARGFCRARNAPARRGKHLVVLNLRNRTSWNEDFSNRTDRLKCSAAAGWDAGVQDEKYVLSNGVADYYAILQVDDDAKESEIKAAYRRLAKECHPDYLGEQGHNLCILLNEAYSVLSNPIARTAYNRQLEVALEDEEDGYTGEILSKWTVGRSRLAKNTDPAERRAVFVDEQSCIGCKQCNWCAPGTFRMESEYGRARVFGQWLDTEDKLQMAVESCPVDCIHWVDKDELPALEYVCRFKQERVDVSAMMAQRGGGSDVFSMRDKFLKERKELDARRKQAMDAMTPMQQEARRQAGEAMRNSQAWIFQWCSTLAEQFAGSAPGTGSADGKAKVGQRRRSSWATATAKPPAIPKHATVPVNRALVLVMSEPRKQ